MFMLNARNENVNMSPYLTTHERWVQTWKGTRKIYLRLSSEISWQNPAIEFLFELLREKMYLPVCAPNEDLS